MEVHASGCQECQVAAMWLCINFAALRRAHASWLENSPGLLSSILLMEGCTHSPMPKVRQFRVPHRRCLRWPAFVGWLSRAAYFFNRMHLGIYWDRFWGNSQFLKVSRYSNFSMHWLHKKTNPLKSICWIFCGILMISAVSFSHDHDRPDWGLSQYNRFSLYRIIMG